MPSSPRFAWSAAAQQYRRSNGRFVSRAEVRAVIDSALARESATTRMLALALRNGNVSLEAWRLSMRDMIKNVHLYDAAAAKGGWAQLKQSDYGRVGQIVRSEYAYLESLARGISSGTIALDGSFVQRANMYAQAGRETFHQVQRASMEEAGFQFERNILHAAEHCGGCLGETARGWVRIGTLIPIGQRTCLRNDRCGIEFSKQQPQA